MIADKFGAARVMAGGTSLYAIGLVLMSYSTTGMELNLSAGLIIGVAMGCCGFSTVYGVIGRTVSAEKRSTAMGIVGAAGSMGQFLMLPYGQLLINHLGWQQALLILALTVLVRGMPSRDWRELLLPFALMGAIAVFVTLRIKGVLFTAYEPFAQETLARMAEPADTPEASLGSSIINQGYLFFHYLLVWLLPNPHWMTVDARPVFPSTWLGWPHTAGFVAWLAWFVVAVAQLRKGGVRGVCGFIMLFPWLMALTEVATLRVQEPLVLYRSYLWMCVLSALLPLALLAVCKVPLRWAITAAAVVAAILVAPMQNRLETFASALNLWDDAIRYNQSSTAPLAERGYHNRGFAHLQARQYTRALADFSQAININPRDASAYLGRGVAYARTGSHELAVQELNRAIVIAPGYAEAYAKRCFVRMMQDNPPAALPDCEKAVALNPRHLEALTNRGVVYAALDRVTEAAQSYQRALEIDGTNADAHYNFGVLHLTQQRAAQARPHLKIACDAKVRAACDMLRSLK